MVPYTPIEGVDAVDPPRRSHSAQGHREARGAMHGHVAAGEQSGPSRSRPSPLQLSRALTRRTNHSLSGAWPPG